ncbi:glycosyltransferase [Psychroflexus sp. CAK1W]|uniref:glycosyltransferase n=1 Tax=Psychroflexus curvus TaxID=2873595 RepID=UPI001CC97C01|nr:glycosyltransferase [Psychroflexus curvus]MBZ9629080.1 glycosyltransferase [Psychroflexus curvus]
MKKKTAKNLKIAMIARTNGLEYDDRIRKECITLSKIADIKIFVNFSDNREGKGVTSYGIPFESIKLKSREKLKQKNNLILKSLEFYLKVKSKLKHYDMQWIHGEETAIFALFAPKNKFIWDQHELPESFYKKPFKSLFHRIEKNCSYMLHANSYRIDYLRRNGVIEIVNKHISIRNYPDNIFSDKTGLGSDENFMNWLNDHEYVYLQGISKEDRLPYNTLEAILSETDLKIVIVGGLYKQDEKKLLDKYGDIGFKNKVYNTGMVNQLDIPIYLKNAKFSVVLYDISNPNNRYCEPNRMYQALSYGIPVIVGCNEPMKDLVDSNNFGIVLEDDGNNVEILKKAIRSINIKSELYKEMIIKNKQKINWCQQEDKILELLNV